MWEILMGIFGLIMIVAFVAIWVGVIIGLVRKRWRVLLWSTVVFGAAIALTIVTAALDGTFDGPESNETSAAPLSSTAPTRTASKAIPTYTPRPRPTSTPRPPTPTVVACPTEQELTYFLSAAALSNKVAPNFGGFARQNQLMGSNPSVITREDWQVKTVLHLVAMQIYVNEVKELSAPPSVKYIHELHLQSVDALQSAIDSYTYGLDNLDIDALFESAALLEEHNVLIDKASAAVENYCK